MEKKKIVVLGGGESGVGSAVLAQQKGFDVFLSDKGPVADKYKAELERYAIPYEEKRHTFEKIYAADEVIKSPGIPIKAEAVQGLMQRGIPIVSEIEFAGRYTQARHICVTGSNGKTTTVSLIYDILRKAGMNVGVGGNIGASYAWQVATSSPDWFVLELSSFQLDNCYAFRPDVAVITNITPDHLDRYDYKMENYTASKFRIVQAQRPEDVFIHSLDNPETTDWLEGHPVVPRQVPFSVKEPVTGDGAFMQGDRLVAVVQGRRAEVAVADLKLQGLHNYANILCAMLAALEAGVPGDAVREAVCAFEGVEHRMEPIPTGRKDILYINDSKATNIDSAWYALQSMTRPTVWIAGGTDKGNDYATLYPVVGKVHTLICMGLDNEKLKKSFEGVIPHIYDTRSLEEAVEVIGRTARSGDTVLLSPACASFDLFKNYEDRGRRFKEAIVELNKDHKG